MARISTRNLLDGGQRVTPPTTTAVTTPAIDPQDIRSKTSGLTPAQVAAQKALNEAVAAGAALGIRTTPNVATPGNVPTVTVTKVPGPTGPTGPGSTGPTGPGLTGGTGPAGGAGKTVVSTYTDPETGDVIAVYSDGTTAILSRGTKALDAARAKAEADAAARANRQSAFDLLLQQFANYGLQALVEPLRGLIESGVSPSEFTIRLRETDAYKKRFAANQARINKGLRALSEAEYINLEDQYQDVMRRYGLPNTYYARGDMGRQEGFEKFIGGDVSPVELEDRIQTAQRRVINAAPQIKDALTQYYGDEISNGDILAYVLDPDKAIESIKRKVGAAEIGGAATMAGLGAARTRAEELQRFGVTAEQARQGFTTISEFLPQAQVLGERYAKQGMGPFTQETAEQEVFAIPGAAEAGRKRRKLAELETAAFSGQAGVAGGALGRERAGAF